MSIVPSIPGERDQLEEAAAASEPTLGGAWWVTVQFLQHLWMEAAPRDHRTLLPLPVSLMQVLEDLPSRSDHPRPLPHDTLALAAHVLNRPLKRLLQTPNTRIERRHVMQPIYALREVDRRSMVWLAQQPGRTVREKLGTKGRGLGVIREHSVDVLENRVLRQVTRLLGEETEQRLSRLDTYGPAPERQELLEELEALCTSRLRRSVLVDVPPARSVQPNNALLDHPDYAKVWRVFQLLRLRDERLMARWGAAEDSFRAAVVWALLKRLLALPGSWTWERVLSDDHSNGAPPAFIDQLQHSAFDVFRPMSAGALRIKNIKGRFGFIILPDGQDAYFNEKNLAEGVSLDELQAGMAVQCTWGETPRGPVANEVRPLPSMMVTRLKLRGSHLEILGTELHTLSITPDTPDHSGWVRLERDTGQALAPGRGVPWVASREDGSRKEVYADALGLTELIDWMCGALPTEVEAAPVATTTPVLGVEWSGDRWWTSSGSAPQRCMSKPRVTEITLCDKRGSEWLADVPGRVFHPEQRGCAPVSLEDLLEVTADDAGHQSIAIDHIIATLASTLGTLPAHSVAWAVPDRVSDLAQRALRAGFSVRMGRALPVWRSVAAAMTWMLRSPAPELRSGDVLLVLDAEGSALTATFLVARHDKILERKRPASRGIYWERRPSLPVDDLNTALSANQCLANYAKHLIAETELPAEEQEQLVTWLLSTGQIEGVLMDHEVLIIPHGGDWITLDHSPDAIARSRQEWGGNLQDAVDAWRNEGTIRQMVNDLLKKNRQAHVLLVGRPFTAWANRDRVGVEIRRILPEARLEGVSHVAQGAWEAGERARLGLVAWRDWLPELYLEVVRGGTYSELPLVEDLRVDAVLGQLTTIEVPQSLVLPAGQPLYRFPLESGRKLHRPMGFDVELRSGTFPLDHDVEVRLTLEYQYGLSDAWTLRISPTDEENAPFSTITAAWSPTRTVIDPAHPGPIPPFSPHIPQRDPSRAAQTLVRYANQTTRLMTNMDWSSDSDRDAVITEMRKKRWAFFNIRDAGTWTTLLNRADVSNMMSCMYTFAGVKTKTTLKQQDRNHQYNKSNMVVSETLVTLSCMGVNTPDDVVSLIEHTLHRRVGGTRIDAAGAVDAASRVLAEVDSRPGLEDLLWKIIGGNIQPWHEPYLYRRGLAALSRVAWRREHFLEALCDRHSQLPMKLLQILEGRLTYSLSLFDNKKQDMVRVASRQSWTFSVVCELLLGLLRLRGGSHSTGLEAGQPRLARIARTIRRLDGLFTRHGKPIHSRALTLKTVKPRALHHVSDLAWVTSSSLIDEKELGLVQIAASDEEL